MNFITSPVGAVHTGSALLALVLGTLIFLLPKGTHRHKLVGYTYAGCMLTVNASAFGIYQLLGHFGPFHAGAIVSLLTLTFGLVPVVFRWPRKSWLTNHYYFMNWSVVGLYAAFWTESTVRLFDMRYLWWVTVLMSGLTCVIGAVLIHRYRGRWIKPAKAADRKAEPIAG